MSVSAHFDVTALMRALDAERAGRGLEWTGLAQDLTDLSSDLNAELADHSVCQGALVRTVRRGTMSCQYALMILRWIGRAPEDFLTGPTVDVGDTRLPDAGPHQRLRWNLPRLYTALDEARRERDLTWAGLGETLGYTPNRLTNLRSARLADMNLTMTVTQWVGRPAAAFVEPARW